MATITSFVPSKEYVTRSKKEISKAIAELDSSRDDKKFKDFKPLRDLVLDFAKRNNIIVYGGSAVNHYLPEGEKIYDENDITDVDMMSPDSECFAKKLADELDDTGVKYVESRESKVHDKTFSIKGMEIGILADISLVKKETIRSLRSIQTDKPYAPIEYLFYSMHCEFSVNREPRRWEKIHERFITADTTNRAGQ